MNRLTLLSALLFQLIASVAVAQQEYPYRWTPGEAKEEMNDWYVFQRMIPYGTVDAQAHRNAAEEMVRLRSTLRSANTSTWQPVGPLNIGGRLTDVEMPGGSLQIMYACAASGGVFKSSDAGNSWTPVFDNQPSLSIGDLAIAPSNQDILYVGTGEPNCGSGSITYDGAGTFKSTDGGLSWTSVGLDQCRNIGRIAVHPTNPDIVFVAAMGDLFGTSTNQGLYRSLDGGSTWQQFLFLNDSTGAIDVAIDPVQPSTVYACTWTRRRRIDRRSLGGPDTGLWKSTDGGTTWTRITTAAGLPSGFDYGRTSIGIAATNPNTLYYLIADAQSTFQGVYKSTNGGATWSRTNDTGIGDIFNGGAHWEGRLKVDPTDANTVYLIGFDTWKTTDGGQSWNNISGNYHPDNHEVYIHPMNHDYLLRANDGGLYYSYDGGQNWYHDEKLPVTQFYTCEVDELDPLRHGGGTQDNGTVITTTGLDDDWYSIWGGDGFHVLFDPYSGNIYAEYQYGGLNTGTNGVDPSDRFNWNTPLEFNPQSYNTLLLGSNRVNISYDQGANWQGISPDLTNHNLSGYPFTWGTVTTLAMAPSDTNVIYAGTDDGNVWVTTNHGSTWQPVYPMNTIRWVTHVAVDPHDAAIAYVTLSGYRFFTNTAHVYRTTDFGASWIAIEGNLPDVPCNDLIPDPDHDSTLFLATDVGVFVTLDLGVNWSPAGTGMPVVPVCDIRLHDPTRTLYAGTYGRSMWALPVDPIFTGTSSISLTRETTVYPNPFTDQVFLTSEKRLEEVRITAADGSLIGTRKVVSDGRTDLSDLMADLPAGIYYLRLISRSGSEVVPAVKIR
ncbi:MAG: hypothetical protein RL021_1490 [Bacteroidota bacterium]|jgi:photosystem II stability/assembly factor-like uncharacterized protein